MKDLSLLVFLSQLGLSVVLPLAGFVLLGVWLRQALGWGVWVVILGTLLGLVVAAEGLRSTLRTMNRMAHKKKDKPPVSFNDHE